MVFAVYNLDGRRVHTGAFRTKPEYLEELCEVSTSISDISFYGLGKNGYEKVPYNERLARRGEIKLGIQMWRLNSFSEDKVNFQVRGFKSILSFLKDLGVKDPNFVESAIGKHVITFRDQNPFINPNREPGIVWGVYVSPDNN